MNNGDKILIEGAFGVILNANDTFGYACADSHELSHCGLIIAREIAAKFGHDGLTAIMAFERGYEPLKPLMTKDYKQAKKEIIVQLQKMKDKYPTLHEYYIKHLEEKRKTGEW